MHKYTKSKEVPIIKTKLFAVAFLALFLTACSFYINASTNEGDVSAPATPSLLTQAQLSTAFDSLKSMNKENLAGFTYSDIVKDYMHNTDGTPIDYHEPTIQRYKWTSFENDMFYVTFTFSQTSETDDLHTLSDIAINLG